MSNKSNNFSKRINSFFNRNLKRVSNSFVKTPFNQANRSVSFQQQATLKNYSIWDYVNFYNSIEPLADAIDLLSAEFSSLQMKVYDTKNKIFVPDHPVLELFKFNNSVIDYIEFAIQELSFLEITGNCFWILELSQLDSEPLSIECVPPQWLGFIIGDKGLVTTFNYNAPYGNNYVFNLIIKDGRYRYMTDDGKRELFQLKRFNPNSSGFRAFGQSRLHSLAYQLEHFISLCNLNISQLKNGGRPSGILQTLPTSSLTPDQLQDTKVEANNVLRGELNAGRILVLDQLEWKSISFSNRDCAYNEARQQIKEEIYNRFKIPLSLINSNALSLANMEVAERQLYNLSILPTTSKIFSTLTRNLMFRYPNSEDLIFFYDKSTIPALKLQNLEELNMMVKFNVLSDNEIRHNMNFNLADGGDVIYKPANLVPTYNIKNNGK